MSTYTPAYGITEALETTVVKSRLMVRLNAHDIIKNALNKNRPELSIVNAEFVEFHDNGDLIFQATLIKPAEKT